MFAEYNVKQYGLFMIIPKYKRSIVYYIIVIVKSHTKTTLYKNIGKPYTSTHQNIR